MPTYKAPVEDVLFLLTTTFSNRTAQQPRGFADATPDLIEAILNEGRKALRGGSGPLNRATRKAASATMTAG